MATVSSCADCNEDTLGCLQFHNEGIDIDAQGALYICVKAPDGSSPPYGFAVVCYVDDKQFNDGSAAAACRQMGFLTFNEFDTAYKYAMILHII